MESVSITKTAVLVACLGIFLVPMSTYAQQSSRPVLVVNNPAEPVPVLDVENPALAPFQESQVNVPFDSGQLGVDVNFVVPAGERLVIEFASGTALLAQGRVTAVQLVTVVNGVVAAHNLTFSSTGPAGGFPISYTANQQMRLYADPGTTVAFRVQRDIGGAGVVHAAISGYLVNVP